MSQRSIVRATFTVERAFPHSPARVFKAFSDREAKDRWFKAPDGYQGRKR